MASTTSANDHISFSPSFFSTPSRLLAFNRSMSCRATSYNAPVVQRCAALGPEPVIYNIHWLETWNVSSGCWMDCWGCGVQSHTLEGSMSVCWHVHSYVYVQHSMGCASQNKNKTKKREARHTASRRKDFSTGIQTEFKVISERMSHIYTSPIGRWRFGIMWVLSTFLLSRRTAQVKWSSHIAFRSLSH